MNRWSTPWLMRRRSSLWVAVIYGLSIQFYCRPIARLGPVEKKTAQAFAQAAVFAHTYRTT